MRRLYLKRRMYLHTLAIRVTPHLDQLLLCTALLHWRTPTRRFLITGLMPHTSPLEWQPSVFAMVSSKLKVHRLQGESQMKTATILTSHFLIAGVADYLLILLPIGHCRCRMALLKALSF